MTNLFITQIEGTQRYLDWKELNQLKKDILWNFDENGSELINSFLPEGDFELPYWEYLNLEDGDDVTSDGATFYRVGALVLVLSKIAEYIDIPGGNQNGFNAVSLSDIEWYIQCFKPANSIQTQLKEIALLGLSIATTITQEDIYNNDVYCHRGISTFANQLRWVQETFILSYYRYKLS